MEFISQSLVTERVTLYYPILLLMSLLLLTFKYFSSSSTVPPGPKRWPIIGNILQMGEKPHLTLTRYAKIYGPLISVRLGMQTLVVGSSKAAAEEILRTHDRVLSGRYVPRAFGGNRPEIDTISMGWTSECNGRWTYLRTICRSELFSGKALESQACLREKKVMEMVSFLRKKEGKVVKIGEVVFNTVFNVLSNVLVSRDFVSLEEEMTNGGIKELIRSGMEAASAINISDFYPFLAIFDLQRLKKKVEEVTLQLFSMWDPIIKERRERREEDATKKQDFLDAMLLNAFTDDQINQMLMELITAGTDTSTSTVEWTMAELIKNPKYMKGVQEELEREIHNKLVQESDLSKLHFLQACVKEALRLHPPAPFLLPRRAPKSTEVDPNHMDMSDKFGVTLQKKEPLFLIPKLRM
ncbi:Cytochrome P450 [Dillenia turbinata]|uniref:Cytochrome P450 n=1 Tax=Dillenia turbinata TaxID=194707 RepID=A0AAN8W7R3_9MAGN